nr:MAG: ORF1 [Anelloviridae sp.]
MAWGRRRRRYRRRWRRYPRRRFTRRRRLPYRFRARRRRLRPQNRRGYRRRNWVRRRYPRKRQYKGTVTQWNPQHRTGCKIRGWSLAIMAIEGHFGEKTEIYFQSSTKPDRYLVCGGGVSYRHFTLGMFYQEHLLFRNEWSTSNQGYDLARYFGTKLRFYPHEHVDFMVYWETTFEVPEKDEMPELAPGSLINKRHKIIVHSLKRRGRSKRLFIKPPPVHTNQWYFQKTWCNVPLFKIGIVPINFRAPFLHNRHFYGVWIGYTCDTEPPITITWTRNDIEKNWGVPTNKSACPANGGKLTDPNNQPIKPGNGKIGGAEQWKRRVYYRWWWDDGVDNYIMINQYNRDPLEDGLNNCIIKKVDMPYWKYFWGLSQLTSKASPLCLPGTNPSIYALTWYKDVECRKWTETEDKPVWPLPPGSTLQYPDQDLCGPDTIPTYGRRKFWVILSQCWPWATTGYHTSESWCLPNYDVVRTILTGITNNGPFADSFRDVYPEWQNLNIGFTYCSYWQWGGFRPKPDTTQDPCAVGGNIPPRPGNKFRSVQVDDPSDTSKLTIHPWDLTQNGIYTTETFKRLLSDIYPELLADRPLRQAPDGQPLEELRPKWKEIDGARSRAVDSSSSEETSTWRGSGESSSEIETKESPGDPTMATRVVRKRKRLLRDDPREFRRVKRRLNRFLNERDARPKEKR